MGRASTEISLALIYFLKKETLESTPFNNFAATQVQQIELFFPLTGHFYLLEDRILVKNERKHEAINWELLDTRKALQ